MREVLLILLGVLLRETEAQCPGWAVALVKRAARRLSPQKRERWEDRWLGEIERRPGRWAKLILALHFGYSSWKINLQDAGVSVFERVMWVFMRAGVALSAGGLLVLDVLYALTAFKDFDAPFMGFAHLGTLLVSLMAFRGGFTDWPWLRTNRTASLLLLSLITATFAAGLLGILSGTPLWTAMVLLNALGAWETYWANTRPLPSQHRSG